MKLDNLSSQQDSFGPWGKLVGGSVMIEDSPKYYEFKRINSTKSKDQNGRIEALKNFLKKRNLNPEKLSDEQLLQLQEVFFQQSGDEVIKAYKDMVQEMKKGGPIHIKKQNRGEFTKYCKGKVTQECITRGKNSPDPKIRKQATFADNARKWKHYNGGKINYINIFK